MIEVAKHIKTVGNGKGQAAITSKSLFRPIFKGTPGYGLEEQEVQEVQPSYGSTDERVDKFKIPLAGDYGIEKKSQTAISVVRTFYSKKINESLDWLSKNHETPIDSTPYIQPLLENLKKYKDDHFTDPYSSFLSGLYDALVFNDSWMELTKDQFAQITKIIIRLNNNPKLDYDVIDKAINELEKLGLDTTPF